MQNFSEAELQAMGPKVIVRYATLMSVFVMMMIQALKHSTISTPMCYGINDCTTMRYKGKDIIS